MTTEAFASELSNRDVFIIRWEHEYPGFLRVFQSLPAQKLEYRHHPRSRSAGELIALLVSSQRGCIQLCKNRKSMYNGIHWDEPKGYGKLDEMIRAYENEHNEFRTQLHALDTVAWHNPAWLVRGAEEILLKNTVGGLLWIALFDMVHHRGQLSTHIRPMGGKVPSIYGPSADEEAAELKAPGGN